MSQLRFASGLIVVGAGFVVSCPALAGSHGGYGNHGASGGMHMMSQPGAKPAEHRGGCCGGHMGGGSGRVFAWHGGKPALGSHPMGMHFYGMGGGSSGSHSYGTGGGHDMHVPLGSHMMGMHYYGMSGGSLAKYYGHLEHEIPTGYSQGQGGHKSGSGYGGSAYDGAQAHQPKAWGTPAQPTSYSGGYGSGRPKTKGGDAAGYRYVFHESYRFKASFHYSYGVGSKFSHGGKSKPGGGASGKWGSSGSLPASYAAY